MRHPRAVFLALLALPLAIAQGPPSPPAPQTQPPSRLALSLHGLKKAVGHFFDGKKGLLCLDCIQLAVEIDALLYKPPSVESDDLNIGGPGPGRRMRLPHKEEDIVAALDAACAKTAELKGWGADVAQDCEQHVQAHRRALEETIFDKGTTALASSMCIERFNLCNPHTLTDSGEL